MLGNSLTHTSGAFCFKVIAIAYHGEDGSPTSNEMYLVFRVFFLFHISHKHRMFVHVRQK